MNYEVIYDENSSREEIANTIITRECLRRTNAYRRDLKLEQEECPNFDRKLERLIVSLEEEVKDIADLIRIVGQINDHLFMEEYPKDNYIVLRVKTLFGQCQIEISPYSRPRRNSIKMENNVSLEPTDYSPYQME